MIAEVASPGKAPSGDMGLRRVVAAECLCGSKALALVMNLSCPQYGE
jgi:hypothetical protein